MIDARYLIIPLGAMTKSNIFICQTHNKEKFKSIYKFGAFKETKWLQPVLKQIIWGLLWYKVWYVCSLFKEGEVQNGQRALQGILMFNTFGFAVEKQKYICFDLEIYDRSRSRARLKLSYRFSRCLLFAVIKMIQFIVLLEKGDKIVSLQLLQISKYLTLNCNDNNLLDLLMKKSQKRITNFPFYKRESSDRSQQRYRDKYILIGLARNDISGIQVYLHYFCSIYKRHYAQNQVQKQFQLSKDISYFFLQFVRIILLRSLIGENSQQTNFCTKVAYDILGIEHKQNSDEKMLAKFSRIKEQIVEYVQNIYTKEYRKYFKSQSKSQYLFEALRIEKQIRKILQQVNEKIDNISQFRRIRQEQILPLSLGQKHQIRQIKSNFQSICNIQILRKSYKKQILQKFRNINNNYVPTTIQLLMESKYKESPNNIFLHKYTLQSTPILMKLQTYTKLFPRGKFQNKLYAEISRSIAKNCLNYHRKTYNFYPYLSLGDIFIDQKKIASVLSYRPLILDALGLNGNIKNFILRIATEPTPNAINYEKYFKEFDQKSRILLNRKYYQPNYLKDQSHYDIHQNMVKNMNQEDEIAMQKQIAHQIHTWRLINIIYYIHKGRHLGQDFYDGQIGQKQPKHPLYIDKYIQALQRASEQLFKGQLKLSEIIPIPRQKNQNQQSQQLAGQNQLDFQHLVRHLEVEDNEDSLFENLSWQKFRHQIYNRQLLNKSLSDFVVNNSFTFQKLPNHKKYLFTYYLNQLENIQQLRIKRQKYLSLCQSEDESSYSNKEAQLIGQLCKQVNRLSLIRQKEKREKAVKYAESKLYEYSQRKGKVQQYVVKSGRMQMVQYINKQIQLMQGYLNCQSIILEFTKERQEELLQTLKHLSEKDISQKNETNEIIMSLFNYVSSNSKDIIQIQKKLEESKPIFMNEVQNKLKRIIQLLMTGTQQMFQQIKKQPNCHEYPKQKDKEQRQKRDQHLNKYFNCKLELLMFCVFNQKQEYWRQYQLIQRYQVEEYIKKGGKMPIEDIKKEIEILEIILSTWRERTQRADL